MTQGFYLTTTSISLPSDEGKQRYRCRNPECRRSSFIREYSYRGYLPEVKQQRARYGNQWQRDSRHSASVKN